MRTLISFDPATEEPVGEVVCTPVSELETIIGSAREVQHSWRKLSLEERRDLILEAGRYFEAEAESIAMLITREMGKPLRDALGEARSVARMADELDEMCAALAPEEVDDGYSTSILYRDPLGVVAAITPWNFPLMMPHWMVLPALMAGNAVVLKPSEETPLTGQMYVDIMNRVLPPGLLTAVHGDDEQGRALVEAPVDLVAFTGSRSAGIHILRSASAGLKRVILELGGKDPLVVLPGAQVEDAARFAARNAFRNAGQVCVSTERIYVHEDIYDAFLESLATHTKSLKQGPGTEPGVQVGPMVHGRQRDWVLKQVREAVEAGARLVVGATEAQGNFIPPTVLADVNHSMSIARDETFGPVACVTPFSTQEEAIQLANDTPYGLGASVWGADAEAREVAREMTAGMIGINRGCGGAAGTPWVGARQSGYGFHSSPEGHRQFAQVRVVTSARRDR